MDSRLPRAHAELDGTQPLAASGEVLEYLLFRAGPLSMSPSQLGAFACSSVDVARAVSNITYSRCRSIRLANRCIDSMPHRQRL